MAEQINFVTFGDSNGFKRSIVRIASEAKQMGVFTNIWACNEHALDQRFRQQHKAFMVNNKRGYGYYIWKPQIILQCLRKTAPGATLVYADCGCELSPTGKPRLLQYIDMARNDSKGLLAFQMGHPEKDWTKMDTILRVFPTPTEQLLNSGQILGGINVWIHRPETIAFLEEWVAICVEDGYHHVSDAPSRGARNAPSFREHRHDQSVFSLLCKKYGVTAITDETYDPHSWRQRGWPVHASRLRV